MTSFPSTYGLPLSSLLLINLPLLLLLATQQVKIERGEKALFVTTDSPKMGRMEKLPFWADTTVVTWKRILFLSLLTFINILRPVQKADIHLCEEGDARHSSSLIG